MNGSEKPMSFEFDIFDPSFSSPTGYWQIGTAKSSPNFDDWRKVADCINQGFPLMEKRLFQSDRQNQEYDLIGCILWNHSYWLYRIYITGRDKFNRVGRYFFIIFKINVKSLHNLDDGVVSNVMQYLSEQKSIPINTKPLMDINKLKTAHNNVISQVSVISSQKLINELLMKVNTNRHLGWKVKKGNLEDEYNNLPVPESFVKKPPDAISHSSNNKRKQGLKKSASTIIIMLVIAFAGFVLYPQLVSLTKNSVYSPVWITCNYDDRFMTFSIGSQDAQHVKNVKWRLFDDDQQEKEKSDTHVFKLDVKELKKEQSEITYKVQVDFKYGDDNEVKVLSSEFSLLQEPSN